MADQPESRGGESGKSPRKSGSFRFKTSHETANIPTSHPTDESMLIDAGELDSAYQHVDRLGEGTDLVTFGDAHRAEETELDMTPMVDVTFLLLIFFMVTAAFSLQKSIEVPTPHPDQPSQNVQQRDPQEDPDTVTVHVDRFNTYRVVTTDWDTEAPSQPEMLIKLREACQGNSQGRKPTKLLVMASPEALHEKVVAALDAGTEVNMNEIKLMIAEDED